MFLIFISVILAVAVFVVCGIDFYSHDFSFKLNKKQFCAVIPLFLMLLNLIAIVPANNVGILYSPFSGVKEETISEGWQTKGLLDKVYKISTEIQSKYLENITGQTKDGQYVNMWIDVKYKVDPTTAYQVFKQYKNLDNVSSSLIQPVVQRSIEAISTKYNVMDILGSKRNDLYLEIEKELQIRLAATGITFVSINFNDMDAGDAIEQAIQKEAIAKQSVQTAEQERQKSEIEAQKRVVEAQANKQKALIESETKIIEAKAEAQANNLIANSITEGLIRKMEMEARQKFGWVTIQTGTVTPMIDAK